MLLRYIFLSFRQDGADRRARGSYSRSVWCVAVLPEEDIWLAKQKSVRAAAPAGSTSGIS